MCINIYKLVCVIYRTNIITEYNSIEFTVVGATRRTKPSDRKLRYSEQRSHLVFISRSVDILVIDPSEYPVREAVRRGAISEYSTVVIAR